MRGDKFATEVDFDIPQRVLQNSLHHETYTF